MKNLNGLEKIEDSHPTITDTTRHLKPWRLIRFLCEEGEMTMDRDRKLFEKVKKRETLPIFRFYRWKNPSISYGRTQGISPEETSEFIAKGFEVIQRPTGGGKVVHKRDLCFSIIWRKEDASIIPWNINESYCLIHKWVGKGLQELAIKTDLIKCAIEEDKSDRKEWCFQNPLLSDLLFNGTKVVGGAQMRSGETALHQGSIQIDIQEEKICILEKSFESFFHATLLE